MPPWYKTWSTMLCRPDTKVHSAMPPWYKTCTTMLCRSGTKHAALFLSLFCTFLFLTFFSLFSPTGFFSSDGRPPCSPCPVPLLSRYDSATQCPVLICCIVLPRATACPVLFLRFVLLLRVLQSSAHMLLPCATACPVLTFHIAGCRPQY